MNTRRRISLPVFIGIIAIITLAFMPISRVLADDVGADSDTASSGNQNIVNLTANPGETVTLSTHLVVDYKGSKHLVAGSSLVLQVSTNNLPSGYTVSDVSTTVPNPWNANGLSFDAGVSTISFTAPTYGSYQYKVKWDDKTKQCSNGDCVSSGNDLIINLEVPQPTIVDTDGDGIADAYDNCPALSNPDQTDADGDGLGNICDPNTYAPAVSTVADNASGNEGDTLTTSGAFSDADGNNTLAIEKVSGDGDVTDNGDGTWSWSLSTNDNGSGTVTVQASDGEHAAATDSFEWSAANVAPTIKNVVVGSAAACGSDNTITVSFTDPGSADTWNATVDWGDGNSDTSAVTSPFNANHVYTHAGVYTVSFVVTDDDGGAFAATASVTLNFNLSGILQPVNPGSPNSIFKYGSTIPVKVRVTDCDGSYPANLAPKVTYQLLSSGAPDGGVSEPFSTSAADTGNTMRFTGAPDNQYIFNLASKSFPDSTASYRISVTIVLTNQKVSADIGLKAK